MGEGGPVGEIDFCCLCGLRAHRERDSSKEKTGWLNWQTNILLTVEIEKRDLEQSFIELPADGISPIIPYLNPALALFFLLLTAIIN